MLCFLLEGGLVMRAFAFGSCVITLSFPSAYFYLNRDGSCRIRTQKNPQFVCFVVSYMIYDDVPYSYFDGYDKKLLLSFMFYVPITPGFRSIGNMLLNKNFL